MSQLINRLVANKAGSASVVTCGHYPRLETGSLRGNALKGRWTTAQGRNHGRLRLAGRQIATGGQCTSHRNCYSIFMRSHKTPPVQATRTVPLTRLGLENTGGHASPFGQHAVEVAEPKLAWSSRSAGESLS